MKSILQIVLFGLVLFSIHLWCVIPFFNIENTIPVHFQHMLLGGFSLLIFLITKFGAKHYLSLVGFVVLGFLFLKMIFVYVFLNTYQVEIDKQPALKYIFLILYLLYLVLLLVKIIPIINKTPVEK